MMRHLGACLAPFALLAAFALAGCPGPSGPAPADAVLLVALDGADWKVARPLMDAGEMPNLERLVREGASGELATLRPTLSPIIWTSVISGMPPDEHGIHGFWRDVEPGEDASDAEREQVERLKALGYITDAGDDGPAKRLYRSTDRRAPAIWTLFTAAGRASDVIAWWVTYPAEPILGRMVTDRYLYNRFELDSATRGIAYETDDARVSPPGLGERLSPLTVAVDDLDPAIVQRFIDGPVETGGPLTLHDVEDELRMVLAKDESVMNIEAAFGPEGRAPFRAVYLQGVDIASHYFWKYRFPGEWHEKYPDLPIPAGEQQRYGRTVDEAYRLADERLGRLLADLGERTAVVLCSDHGFVTGRRAAGAFGAAQTVSGVHGAHAPPGIVVIAGSGASRGVRLAGASIYDIAPTVMALLGHDVPPGMPGSVLEGALERSRPD